MRNIGLYIFLFLLILFTGDRLLSILIDKFIVSKSEFRYSKLYRGKAKADILIIGNSRGLSFYQPSIEEETGLSVFNLSYNGLPTNLALVLFKDYLKVNGAPKLVIIELTMPGNRKQLITNFGLYSSYSSDVEALIEQQSKSIGISNKLFHLTRYNGELFQRSVYYLNKDDSNWLLTSTISERALQRQNAPGFDFEFDREAMDGYKTIIAICKQNNIPFKLVINPYLPDYSKRIKNFDTYKASIRDYLQEPIYDFSKSITSIEFFSDPLHLNVDGGREYIKLLKSKDIFSTDK